VHLRRGDKRLASGTLHANGAGSGLCFYLVMLVFVCALFACQTVTQETLQANVLDAAINAAVKSRILTDPLGKLGDVSVETIRGQVYLHGVVHTPDDRRRAQDLARETPGALAIVNNLEVREI
jgi:hyperosmotically inducible protein